MWRLRAAFVVVCAALFACTAAGAKPKDETPPSFAGLNSATTCVPGPVGGGYMSPYTLRWGAASDNLTPAEKLVYHVYQASTSGGEDFSTPTYTTRAGATSFTTPPLPADTP